ncbi:MAG: elongation factor 1-beta [Candidatus Lokiarchaeota archaeon]
MGEFIALIDVIPEETDADFEKLVEKVDEKLPKECTIEAHEIMPVAFGLKKARLRIRYPEEWGGTDKLEEYISQVDGLQGIEAIAFSKA